MGDLVDPFILAVIFMIHNLEENVSFDQLLKPKFCKKIFTRQSFRFATVLLSVLVLIFSLPCFPRIHIVILCGLMLNAVQHCVLSLWQGRVLPGTPSALFLIIPFGLMYFVRLFSEGQLTPSTLIEYLVLSAIVMAILIPASLWLGYLLFSKKRN